MVAHKSVAPVPDLMPSSDHLRHQEHMWYTYIHADKVLIHIINLKKKCKNSLAWWHILSTKKRIRNPRPDSAIW